MVQYGKHYSHAATEYFGNMANAMEKNRIFKFMYFYLIYIIKLKPRMWMQALQNIFGSQFSYWKIFKHI